MKAGRASGSGKARKLSAAAAPTVAMQSTCEKPGGSGKYAVWEGGQMEMEQKGRRISAVMRMPPAQRMDGLG